ncbi:peroxisomal ATPase PEX1 [Patella vulgata]|uniref:peroxisomal ATPase PEX1 n=1 Tax=Patella vulgata TaxID=6465 RepID=UPI0021808DCE|nr:peroxisomal ATPase PEX1 [Patella vulgata]
MTLHVATVKYSSNKHCFLTVEQKQSTIRSVENTHNSNQIPVYRCEYDDGRIAYFSLVGHSPLLITQDLIYLNGLFAQKLEIKDSEEVILQLVNPVITANRLEVEPLSTDDWEIVEQHAEFVENHLLDQVRAVWVGQVLPIWVAKSICIFLQVQKIDPEEEYAVLTNDTEVLVAPKLLPNGAKKVSSKPQMTRRHSDPDINPNNLSVENASKVSSDRISKSKSPVGKRKSRHLKNERRHKSDVTDIEADRQRPNLRRQSSLMGRMMGWVGLSKWLSAYISGDNNSISSFNSENFVIKENHLVFRVQALKFTCNPEELPIYNLTDPFSRFMLPQTRSLDNYDSVKKSCYEDEELPPLELFQPSIVFVNHRDVVRILDGGSKKSLPNVFYAELRKLKAPKEVEEEKKPKTSTPTSPPVTEENNRKLSPKKKESNEEASELCCIVRVVTIDKTTDLSDENWQNCAERILQEQYLLSGHALVPDILRRQMKLDVTGRLWLQTVQKPPITTCSVLQLYPLSTIPRRVYDSFIIKAFMKYIETVANDEHPMIVFQGILVKFMVFSGLHVEAQLIFNEEPGSDDRQKYILLSTSVLRQLTITVEKNVKDDSVSLIHPMLPYRHVSDFDPIAPTIQLNNLGAVQKASATAIHHLETCLLTKPLSEDLFSSCLGLNHGILLISGPKGSGKTSLAKAICRRMAEVPNMVFTMEVDCKPLRGKRVDNIQKILELIFDEAAWRQPSIILFEDLHIIAGAATSPDAEMTGEALYAARVAEVITSIIKYQVKNNIRVAIIATSLLQSSLHPMLVTSRGIHFIQEVICIQPPNKKERKELLTKMFENRENLSKDNIKEIDMEYIVNKTEGFVARDLENVIDRAIHAKYLVDWKACSEGEMKLSDEEFTTALEGFKPASFRNVSLHVHEHRSWRDVGGMQEVKDILIETLQWPTKYPALFANCPLRLRSGLLLYGAPGTGKTLIAGVVAKECGLNFISIKGPEVLSKYIGASEQAVRDLFVRAQSAKPCILFFDEFDSMAPRRGHDNTGVTDRVVNQLLTQLDGVEGLDGVYVLAATSRPDLIDGALLRPGRIDKCLHCGLPTKEERIEILEALTDKMCLNQDVDFDIIAEKCEHFTGADLKAVLYNAQLEAIHASTGFALQDSFNDRVKKKDKHSKNVFMTDEMKSAIKEGRYEIQSVEKSVMRRTTSQVEDISSNRQPERPISFHGDEAIQLVCTLSDKNRLVTMIPRLDEGPKELSGEEEEHILNLVFEIKRRNDFQKQTKTDRRGSLHAGRNYPMIQVNQQQLLKAVNGMRPSVSEEERRRYQYIYDTFTSSRSGNFSPGINTAGKKATLA